MGIDTRLRIETLYHPEAEKINKKLYDFISWLPDQTNKSTSLIVTKHTGFHTYPKLFRDFSDWVLQNTSFDIQPEKTELWAAVYNEGDYAEPHTHIPCSYSFVYYVTVPEGSSPLVFEDGSFIDPIPGMCIIFSSDTKHAVPENKSNGRVVLAGNYYT